MNTFNIPGVQIWNGAGDSGCSLCKDCVNLKQGPVAIGRDITIGGESSYCVTWGRKQMQIVDDAVVKCSGYKRKELD